MNELQITGVRTLQILDPLAEEHPDGWETLTAALGGRVQVVGDNLFVKPTGTHLNDTDNDKSAHE